MANADFMGVRRYRKKPSCDSASVPQENSLNQYFLLIQQNRLTELLELLEIVGISGDVAIFCLACLQGGVA